MNFPSSSLPTFPYSHCVYEIWNIPQISSSLSYDFQREKNKKEKLSFVVCNFPSIFLGCFACFVCFRVFSLFLHSRNFPKVFLLIFLAVTSPYTSFATSKSKQKRQFCAKFHVNYSVFCLHRRKQLFTIRRNLNLAESLPNCISICSAFSMCLCIPSKYSARARMWESWKRIILWRWTWKLSQLYCWRRVWIWIWTYCHITQHFISLYDTKPAREHTIFSQPKNNSWILRVL